MSALIDRLSKVYTAVPTPLKHWAGSAITTYVAFQYGPTAGAFVSQLLTCMAGH